MDSVTFFAQLVVDCSVGRQLMIEPRQSPDNGAEILKMESLMSDAPVPDPKANDCTAGDRTRAKGTCSPTLQHHGRNYCRLDAGQRLTSG
jgi:hypothetical protein